ncbi:hypothetical protein [Serratia rubidaea]|uniref:hypothetical protein n=1 Tax=Serratia rubidaea TaxID=61652 RepID=UPI00242C062B|nr:hypothetical protein [Serratia rubidaea]MCR1000500.1 hypothetical protein [Serratia rubidaea]
MSYNKKVWLAMLLLCTLFWTAVIGSACALYGYQHRPAHSAEQKCDAASHPYQ